METIKVIEDNMVLIANDEKSLNENLGLLWFSLALKPLSRLLNWILKKKKNWNIYKEKLRTP